MKSPAPCGLRAAIDAVRARVADPTLQAIEVAILVEEATGVVLSERLLERDADAAWVEDVIAVVERS